MKYFTYVVMEHNVAHLLNARTVEAEKQPLLWNDWVTIYAVTSRNNRRGVASGALYRSAPRLYGSTDQGLVYGAKGRIFSNMLYMRYLHLTKARHIHKRQTHLLVREGIA
jgi:hypothetical protein